MPPRLPGFESPGRHTVPESRSVMDKEALVNIPPEEALRLYCRMSSSVVIEITSTDGYATV